MPTYQKIEQIHVDDQTAGTFKGAVIVSVDMEVGAQGQSSRMIFNLIDPKGNYNISDDDLSYLKPYVISIGRKTEDEKLRAEADYSQAKSDWDDFYNLVAPCSPSLCDSFSNSLASQDYWPECGVSTPEDFSIFNGIAISGIDGETLGGTYAELCNKLRETETALLRPAGKQWRMYLEAYKIDRTPGKRILQLTFVDGGTLLDRIYVALMDKQYKISEENNNVAMASVHVPLLCERPVFLPWTYQAAGMANSGLVDQSFDMNAPIKVSWFQANTGKRNGSGGAGWLHGDPDNLEEGGMIVLGIEEPNIQNMQRDCILPNVNYSFTELLFAMDSWGIKVSGDFKVRSSGKLVDPNAAEGEIIIDTKGVLGVKGAIVKNIWFTTDEYPFSEEVVEWQGDKKITYRFFRYADKNPHFRSNAFGTLRTVLNQWCEMQGYSYSWNETENGVIGTDLTSSAPQIRFKEIKDIIDKKTSQDERGIRNEALIEQASISSTLAGTEKKYHITKAIKQSNPSSTTNFDFYRQLEFIPLDINHIFGPTYRGGITGFSNVYRTDTQFRISCALAMFGLSNAREIFNTAIGCHEANGVTVLAEIETNKVNGVAQVLMQNAILDQKLVALMQQWQVLADIGLKIYLVRYDKKMKQTWENWEKSIASDFMGKYYINFEQLENFERCQGTGNQLHVTKKEATVPRSEEYTAEDTLWGMKLPLPASVLKDPHDFAIRPDLFDGYQKFNLHKKSQANWGTSQQELEELIKPSKSGGDKVDILAPWAPLFKELKGSGANALAAAFPFINIPGVAGGGGVGGGAGGGGGPGNPLANLINVLSAWPVQMSPNVGQLVNNQMISNILGGIANGNNFQTMLGAGGQVMKAGFSGAGTFEYGLLVHPDYADDRCLFHIKNPSYILYGNDKETGMDKQNNSTMSKSYVNECPTVCDSSNSQSICNDLNYKHRMRPYPMGLRKYFLGFDFMGVEQWGFPSFGFQIEFTFPPRTKDDRWTTVTKDVILPTWSPLMANKHSKVYRRMVEPKVVEIINDLDQETPGNVSQVKIEEHDMGNVFWPTAGGPLKVNLPRKPFQLMDVFGIDGGNWEFDTSDLQDFHNDYVAAKMNESIDKPRKTITCTLAGMNWGSLFDYMNPYSGMDSLSIRMGAEGVSTEVRFSNRPLKLPSDSIIMQEVSARAKILSPL